MPEENPIPDMYKPIGWCYSDLDVMGDNNNANIINVPSNIDIMQTYQQLSPVPALKVEMQNTSQISYNDEILMEPTQIGGFVQSQVSPSGVQFQQTEQNLSKEQKKTKGAFLKSENYQKDGNYQKKFQKTADFQKGVEYQKEVDFQKGVEFQKGLDYQKGLNFQKSVGFQKDIDLQKNIDFQKDLCFQKSVGFQESVDFQKSTIQKSIYQKIPSVESYITKDYDNTNTYTKTIDVYQKQPEGIFINYGINSANVYCTTGNSGLQGNFHNYLKIYYKLTFFACIE